MRKLAVTTALMAVMVGSAIAQTGNSSPSSAKQTPWAAPTGHRQPRLDQVPTESSTSADAALKRENAELDRKLKSICRGC
jgi:hypothetical protein